MMGLQKALLGHCIVCHKNNVLMSDEHVIPKSIGGYYHVYNVCDECNSKRFGAKIDPLLTDHPIIKLIRWQKQLKGHKNSYPHPLGKPDSADDGMNYVVSDTDGVLEPHLLPYISPNRDDKGNLTSVRK